MSIDFIFFIMLLFTTPSAVVLSVCIGVGVSGRDGFFAVDVENSDFSFCRGRHARFDDL